MQRNCNGRGLVDPCNLVALLHFLKLMALTKLKAVADYPERLETARYRAVSPAAFGASASFSDVSSSQPRQGLYHLPVTGGSTQFGVQGHGKREMEMVSVGCKEVIQQHGISHVGFSNKSMLMDECYRL